nr:MAG TPA: hypothetical protein [Caudoviricetes sp.]
MIDTSIRASKLQSMEEFKQAATRTEKDRRYIQLM